MTEETGKSKLMVSMFIAALCFCAGLVVLPQTVTMETHECTNDSIMSAEGIFDRIELVSRYFISWNGQEVEGNLLAVLYGNGSVEISTNHDGTHYDPPTSNNRYYTDNKNYLFFLYIYDGVDHLKEEISVESGSSEDFIYSNMTVTVYLGKGIIPDTYTSQVGVLYSTGLWLCSAFFALTPLKHRDGRDYGQT